MKKSLLALASFAAIAVGCQVESTTELPVVENAVVYHAVTEAYAPATKTAMSGLNVVWSANDYVGIYQDNMSADKYVVSTQSVGKTSGTFTLVTSAEPDQTIGADVAVYPYSNELIVIPEMDTNEEYEMVPTGLYKLQGYVLPTTQKYAANSFGNGAFPMVAVNENTEENNFEFKNLLGAVKLQLTGTLTVKSVRLESNAGEPISGQTMGVVFGPDSDPVITFPNPMMTGMSGETSVTLDCGDGVALDSDVATDFVLAVAPTVFEEGFTVTVVTTDGAAYQVVATAENEVKRSHVLEMPVKNIGESDCLGVSVKSTPSLTDVDLDISIDRDDATGFYGIFVMPEMWSIIKTNLDMEYFTFTQVLQGMMGTEMPCRLYEKEVAIKLSEFGLSDDILNYVDPDDGSSYRNMVQPNSSYYVIIVPAVYGEDPSESLGGGVGGMEPLDLDEEEGGAEGEYTLDDAIFFEVTTSGFTAGGTLDLPEYEVTEGYTGSTVTFEASEDIVYMMYEIFKKDAVLPTEDNFIEMLVNDAYYSSEYGCEIEVNNAHGVVPGTEYVLCVLLSDAQGKCSFHTIDVATKPVPFNEALSVAISNAGYNSDDDLIYADVRYSSNTVKLYYNVNVVESYLEDKYEEATLLLDILQDYLYYWTPIDLSTVVNNSLTISVPSTTSTTQNYVHLVAVDAEGNFSHITSSPNCPKAE